MIEPVKINGSCPGRFAVYYLLDTDFNPLYIGVTAKLATRLQQHRGSKPWYGQVAHIQYEAFTTNSGAMQREREAIRKYLPPHNTYLRQGLPKRDRTNAVTITKTFNLPTAVALAIEAEARKQGHNNQSKLATEAMTEYFENHPPRKVF